MKRTINPQETYRLSYQMMCRYRDVIDDEGPMPTYQYKLDSFMWNHPNFDGVLLNALQYLAGREL